MRRVAAPRNPNRVCGTLTWVKEYDRRQAYDQIAGAGIVPSGVLGLVLVVVLILRLLGKL
jgi:Protein of unknown function (DUF3309)